MSNFICEKCGMTNIDCGKQGYKTEREIELEKQLDREIHINRIMKKALEEYAHRSYYSIFYEGCFEGGGFTCEYNGKDYENNELAEETLKQIEEME